MNRVPGTRKNPTARQPTPSNLVGDEHAAWANGWAVGNNAARQVAEDTYRELLKARVLLFEAVCRFACFTNEATVDCRAKFIERRMLISHGSPALVRTAPFRTCNKSPDRERRRTRTICTRRDGTHSGEPCVVSIQEPSHSPS